MNPATLGKNAKKIVEAARYEIGGFENELTDGHECTFFDQTIKEQTEDIYGMIINQVEKEARFVGKETAKILIGIVLAQSEYNQDKATK